MSDPKTPLAWLETSDGNRVPIQTDCPIGRMPDNNTVFQVEKVSRYHALIQHREHDEYFLVDLGSSNGTYHNQRRIRTPVLLHDGDQVHVGDHRLVFRQEVGSAEEERPDKTLLDVRWVTTWLLVADIEGSSRLQQTLPLAGREKSSMPG
jgi:pSer/pThr/pTyr-binding forkhead associated (FHA) protein